MRIVYLAIVILASFVLGFFWGYLKKQTKLTKQIEMMKRLTPKLKWGEDEEKADYLPDRIKGIKIPVKTIKNIEDEDTKTGEMETV